MPNGATNILCFLLVVGAGASVALQQVLNANLRAQNPRSPWWAGFVATLGMLAMLAVATLSGEAANLCGCGRAHVVGVLDWWRVWCDLHRHGDLDGSAPRRAGDCLALIVVSADA